MRFPMAAPVDPGGGATTTPCLYPAPAFLNFCPGGIIYSRNETDEAWIDLNAYSPTTSTQGNTATGKMMVGSHPKSAAEIIIAKAKLCDDRLRQYVLLADASAPIFLPSLSVLAGAVFGKLTGVSSAHVKQWADAMVLQYSAADTHGHEKEEAIRPSAVQEMHHRDSRAPTLPVHHDTTASLLKSLLLSPTEESKRPCGYVFKRGDIAWNCRTCQADSTCVICDSCFTQSNHDGHEVYFHRTSPGGCCDCGDAEAWALEGCCPAHRPDVSGIPQESSQDVLEAVRSSLKGQRDAIATLATGPAALPKPLAAVLGVVIGAAVECLVQAVDGAGIGADPIQWKMKWADEACHILNGVVHDEEYSLLDESTFVGLQELQELHASNKLQLRLHNDDVHTFEEVIEALHEPRRGHPEEGAALPLVVHREAASEMTHHVDADGQVTVKSFTNIDEALQGFRRLKSRGLHCAVVSTAQVDLELRAKQMTSWLSEVASAHPAAAVLVVHALVQVNQNHALGNVQVWREPRMIPAWAGLADCNDEITMNTVRFKAFPPQLASSYVTREEAELLHRMGAEMNAALFIQITATDLNFYNRVPYRIPSERYRKSPHALWGTLPSTYSDTRPPAEKHPLLYHLSTGQVDVTMKNRLTETVMVVDTDLRKQQETDRMISSVYAHKLPGLHMISGAGSIPIGMIDSYPPPLPNPMEWRHLLATCSFRAPISPIVLLLLLDPYPTKQLRSGLHALFLSLLVDIRFKCRFAAALGSIAYRPLSTLFCAGVGTDADTPLGFTVQIFTAGSLVRALCNAVATEKLLKSDELDEETEDGAPVGIFALPIGHNVVRCIHTNILGATKEVHMILNNTATGNDDDSREETGSNDSLLPALTYLAGEHPLLTPLPAAPDDGFLDSRSTRHKRLPHLLRDLEYIIETPGTAIRLLLPGQYPVHPALSTNSRDAELLTFGTVWARLLRTAQGMDPQKRKISGGHVEYEQNRWLEAFGLSLNFAGTRDALAESPTNSSSAAIAPVSADGSHLVDIHQAMGNLFASLLKEIKLWLYREGMLETGLPIPPGGAHGGLDLLQMEALQRSTLHVSTAAGSGQNAVALACATGVKMTEAQLELIESALRIEGAQRQEKISSSLSDVSMGTEQEPVVTAPAMNDWLRVPHSPLAGDSLSFHLPLHRALAKSVISLCSVVVPDKVRNSNPRDWWKLPVIDDDYSDASALAPGLGNQHPLTALIRPTLRSSNCRVVWTSGPDCTPTEAQQRRARAKTVSANIACAKIIHSIADHPIRCLAAAQQIERHLWARNGSSTAGMALNYSTSPLCRSFRDLDLTLVQLSASGLSIGLGARRVFGLLISRFSMDGYLCDPERRAQGHASSPTGGGYGSGNGGWVNPPRLQDPDHAAALSESFFATMCVLVSELPPPPPTSPSDDSAVRACIRRELLHALAAEPKSHSEAMEAATIAASRRDENGGLTGSSSGSGVLGDVFAEVLGVIGKQRNQGSSRAASGPPAFELRADFCDEYDPTFYHLRRSEHQHAMDIVARLRKQKANENKDSVGSSDGDATVMPVVCPPPKAHPRFLPCRLLLHIQPMDAAIRRSLLFALTGGSWLPPAEQTTPEEKSDDEIASDDGDDGVTTSMTGPFPGAGEQAAVPVTTFRRRSLKASGSTVGTRRRSFSDSGDGTPFSPAVVASSSVSFLEILQLLTLQVHTLEECASLHRTQPELDEETKSLSSGLSINSYLGRLIMVPDSLVDEWSLRPFPDGPLPSKGSGANRGSILGLLIALYEHRSDHGGGDDPDGLSDSAHGEQDHGGARTLASSGLKWLLRFVNALVDGAPRVSVASNSASSGIPFRTTDSMASSSSDWTLDPEIRSTVSGMLSNLNDLWPKASEGTHPESPEKASDRNREARKAAQLRIMEMMKKKQEAFVKTLTPNEAKGADDKMEDGENADLCIICRCDDTDGENNGPLGYLGHVQRSRAAQIRALTEASAIGSTSTVDPDLWRTYRVVGHRGCQLRATQAMDSEQLVCLPTGSIVTVANTTVSEKYDILSRRVFVRHTEKDSITGAEKVVEGWASVQSSEGYVILSPLSSLCYTNTRWGSTRPVIRQCGHAAHSKCVEQHILSLHSRAAGDQPYDGRFAANIDDGEFLCPLCKQLSNIVVPRDGCARKDVANADAGVERPKKTVRLTKQSQQVHSPQCPECLMNETILNDDTINDVGRQALDEFGSNLYQAMNVPWERMSPVKKRKLRVMDLSIQHWDYEDKNDEDSSDHTGPVLRLLRQLHIAWASVGHSASAAEEGARAVEKVLPFGTFAETSDPWIDYEKTHMQDTHPMLLELRRTLTATAGLLEVLIFEVDKSLRHDSAVSPNRSTHVLGFFLAGVLEGRSWMQQLVSTGSSDRTGSDIGSQLSQLTALMASMPCHVARDGMISPRHEARAAAAAMWVMKGNGTRDPAHVEPPVPYAIKQVELKTYGSPAEIPSQWGTLDPFVSLESMNGDGTNRDISQLFRPGVASSFLYMPLLAWDLHTLAGAIFSTMLASNADQLPTATDFLQVARILLFGRVVQAIVTPNGLDTSVMFDDDELLEFWLDEEELQKEKTALTTIVLHCRKVLSARSLEIQTVDMKCDDNEADALFEAVSGAILPFARSLILLLRAATSVVRLRERKSGIAGDHSSQDDKLLDSLLGDAEIMTSEDGFRFLKELGGPLPSHVSDDTETSLDGSSWTSLMNRWLLSAIGLEINHSARSTISDAAVAQTPTASPSRRTSNELGAAVGYTTPDTSFHSSQPGIGDRHGNLDHSAAMDIEEEAMDDGNLQGTQHREIRIMFDNQNVLMDNELADSDEDDDMDMMDIDNVQDEIIAFAETALGASRAPLPHNPLHPLTTDLLDDTSDDNTCANMTGMSEKEREAETKYAGVGRSPILAYQPSLLGLVKVGPGKQGAPFEYDAASNVMHDLSHLGMIHRHGIATNCLIRLPKSFVELYGLVNRVRGRDEPSNADDGDEGSSSETAICLLTGAVMRSGTPRRAYARATRPAGACTVHAREVGSGTGIFFLVQKCTVLLMHNNKSAYSASLYVDRHGEEDPGLRRGRPLFLNDARYRELEMLWRQQGIPREVAQIRSTSDRVIRDNWY